MLGLSISRGALRIVAAVAIAGAGAWACELEGDPPTVLPLGETERAIQSAYCERMFACSCTDGRRYDMQDACDDRIDERIGILRSELDDNALNYDGACLGQLVDVLDASGCKPARASDVDECQAPCNPVFGTKQLGDACLDLVFGSDCVQGLSCEYDCDDVDCFERCIDRCGGVCGVCEDDERCEAESGSCVPRQEIGESCEEFPCVPEATCLYDDADGRSECISLPTEGESCTETGSCAEDLLCQADPTSGEATCVAKPGQGDPCTGHNQCSTGFCPAGFCDTLPGLGESCAGTSACAEGLQCDSEDRKCVTADAAVCRQDLPYF